MMPSQVQTLQLILLQNGKLEKSALKIKINFAHERILSLTSPYSQLLLLFSSMSAWLVKVCKDCEINKTRELL